MQPVEKENEKDYRKQKKLEEKGEMYSKNISNKQILTIENNMLIGR